MDLKKGMLITLTDDKEYIVVCTLLLNKTKYVYLSENENIENIKFCVEEIESGTIKLTEVEDIYLRQNLLENFTQVLLQDINN